MLSPSWYTESITKIAKELDKHNIVLSIDDIIVGGFVRDIIYDIPYTDIDVYSPTPIKKTGFLLADTETQYYSIVRGGRRYRAAVYTMPSGVKIDHKFTKFTPNAMSICNTFQYSICQVAYSPLYGIYATPEFLKTTTTGEITYNPNLLVWNPNKPDYDMREKLEAKFPNFEFDTRVPPDEDNIIPIAGRNHRYFSYDDDDDYGS